MPADYSDKRVLFWDHGQFCFLAEKLAESFGEVLYYVPVESGFPTSSVGLLGMGLEGVERVYEFWDYVDRADLIVFPDCYDGDVQTYLRAAGKPVWGSGYTNRMELDRWGFRDTLKQAGLKITKAELVVGVDDLADYLIAYKDVYVKASFFRGDFETFHHIKWQLTQPWFDELRTQLGPRGGITQFIVEQSLKGVEVGFDGYHVGGLLPAVTMFGYEAKDLGYVGKVVTLGELPATIRETTQALSPFLKGVSAPFHNEIRVTENGDAYLTDPTMRCGSPPSECMVEAFSNWDEVMFEGARGNMVALEPTCKYAAQLILKSEWVQDHFLPVYYSDKIAKWVKLHNACCIDGVRYCVKAPGQPGLRRMTAYPEFGAVVGIGDTLESAIEECLKHSEGIKSLELSVEDDSFNDIFETIKKGEEVGIDW